MAADEQEEEREFLAQLKARSGHDLAEWMAAITAQPFSDKNEIIDWLRAQGFPFARASWLERIHKNGGRPIYTAGPSAEPERPVAPPAVVRPPPAPRKPSREEEANLEKLLAAAKGYRPLYHLLEAQIREGVPSVTVVARPGYISFCAPEEFAAVTVHATELRLGLNLGDRPFDPTLQKAHMRGPGAGISHMIVLTDARRVNADLLSLIKAANARVNA